MPNREISSEIIVDKSLILKRLKFESAPLIFDVIDSNRKKLRKWLPFVDSTRKVEDTEMFIKSISQTSSGKQDLIYEIWTENDFAGLVALKEIDHWNKKTELGYWMDPHFEGMGIMTKCCRALTDYAFNQLGIYRVQIKTATGNAPSARIPEKLGFRFEGIERAGEKHRDGYFNLEIYSILKHEWKN
jgi:ribosomal-protein-serine acetyltransferase